MPNIAIVGIVLAAGYLAFANPTILAQSADKNSDQDAFYECSGSSIIDAYYRIAEKEINRSLPQYTPVKFNIRELVIFEVVGAREIDGDKIIKCYVNMKIKKISCYQ